MCVCVRARVRVCLQTPEPGSKHDHETSRNMFTCVGISKSILQLCPSRDKFGLLFHLWKSCFKKQKLSFFILFEMSFFKISGNVT